jgi:hypothetical protein
VRQPGFPLSYTGVLRPTVITGYKKDEKEYSSIKHVDEFR